MLDSFHCTLNNRVIYGELSYYSIIYGIIKCLYFSSTVHCGQLLNSVQQVKSGCCCSSLLGQVKCCLLLLLLAKTNVFHTFCSCQASHTHMQWQQTNYFEWFAPLRTRGDSCLPLLPFSSFSVEFFGLNELNEISTTFAFVFCSCDDFQFFLALTFIYLVW